MVCTGGVKGVSPPSSRFKVLTRSVEKANGRRFDKTSKNSLEMTTNDAAHEKFLLEAETYAFRFRCYDCAHWDIARSSCTFGYPSEMLRDPTSPVRDQDGQWIFCKYFELGETLEPLS